MTNHSTVLAYVIKKNIGLLFPDRPPHNLSYPKNMDIIFFIIIFSIFLLQKCAFLKYFGGGGIACLPTFPLLKMRFMKQQTNYFLKAYRLSELNFFLLLKVANIRCFILIAVEIFHNIIRK